MILYFFNYLKRFNVFHLGDPELDGKATLKCCK